MQNKIGEKHITNEGYNIEIIEPFSYRNCSIKFDNGVIINNRQYIDVKMGRVKNPYHKSLEGVGYFGVGTYNKVNCLKGYSVWRDVLRRCYSEKRQEKLPTYKDATVCEHWHNFQVFAQWHEKSWKPYMDSSWHLDKDILVKGNKIYSPETCAFVPQEINALFIKSEKTRGDCPIGVHKSGNKYIPRVSINGKRGYLGYFDTPEEAFRVYKKAKEDYIKEVADKWKNLIIPRVYQAMYEYQVEITD